MTPDPVQGSSTIRYEIHTPCSQIVINFRTLTAKPPTKWGKIRPLPASCRWKERRWGHGQILSPLKKQVLVTLAKVVRNFILGGPLQWGLQEGREVQLNSEYNLESGDLWPRSKVRPVDGNYKEQTLR